MVISLRVSVPVLSEQITEVEPSVSTLESFLTMARCRAMRCTPTASTTLSTAGKPSGTAATASDTPSKSTSTNAVGVLGREMAITVPTTPMAMATTAIPSTRPTRASSTSSGVGSSCVCSSSPAMWPTSVPMPVATTTERPTPCATAVPL